VLDVPHERHQVEGIGGYDGTTDDVVEAILWWVGDAGR
jgi:hypothetical protein